MNTAKRYKKGQIIEALGIFPCGGKKVQFERYCKKSELGYIEGIDLSNGQSYIWYFHEILDTPAAKVLYKN